jgi:hypothetical protein
MKKKYKFKDKGVYSHRTTYAISPVEFDVYRYKLNSEDQKELFEFWTEIDKKYKNKKPVFKTLLEAEMYDKYKKGQILKQKALTK